MSDEAPKKHPGGRPSKLTPELIEIAKNYISEYKTHIPSKVGLALFLRCATQSVDNWAAENEEFLGIVEEILQVQHEKLMDGGLGGEYNASISKLILSKHGYSDTVKQELTGAGGGALKFQEVTFVGVTNDSD